MRKAGYLVMAVVLTGLVPWAHGQSGDTQQGLQQKLASRFALTKTTADKSDIVTAGAVLVLHKDGLLMYSVAASAPATNTYKGGTISHNRWLKCPAFIPYCPSVPEQPANRTFVAGEKFWVTGFEIQSDAVIFSFYSDLYQDTRYYGRLKFPFPKGQMPPADETLKTIAEVVTVQPADSAAVSAPPSGPPAPIPPPPPPADAPPLAPKTISLGQPKEQVIAVFGQPQKLVNLRSKEIDYYPDMKVIFVNGKVSDVQ